MTGIGRRAVLVGAGAVAAATGITALGFSLPGGALRRPPGDVYGPLQGPDALGVRLPARFTARVVARSSQLVPGTEYRWHHSPDGGACFADGDGWIYVSNAERTGPRGGVGALRFDAGGRVTAAYPIAAGTARNCSGGATPWDTWLTCEEVDAGQVYECDPWGRREAAVRPAMGRFAHEAAACDPQRRVVYLTEDKPDGGLYRYVPAGWGGPAALADGRLEVLTGADGGLSWRPVPDPDARRTPTRHQVPGTLRFRGGEGAYYRAGVCYFTTKGDNRVWAYDAVAHTLRHVYDGATSAATLTGVDNLTADPRAGDLYVCEDGGDMEIRILTRDGQVAPFAQLVGQDRSELCGVAFNPAGDRLYFSSQRGVLDVGKGGITYEVTGPFRSG